MSSHSVLRTKTALALGLVVGLMGLIVAACAVMPEAVESRAESAPMVARPMARQPKAAAPEGSTTDSSFSAESYKSILENKSVRADENPLSTFSIDVDTAAYANVRRFLRYGELPPADAVRIEELINYFSYDYPEPEQDLPFRARTEIASCPWNADHRILHLGLQARKISFEALPPNNLVFLVDVSGSMEAPDKLPLLRTALVLLMEEMRDEDSIAVVVYAGAAGLALPPTSLRDKHTIVQALENLQAGGSTAGGAGIELAYKTAQASYDAAKNNRVILCTDGDFNVGVTSETGLVRLIEQKRDQGIYLTVLGFGTGNYQDATMESLADRGNGNYAYIDSIQEAKKVLVNEMGATLFTIAKDMKVQVEFNADVVESYRLIGYENRVMRDEEFHDDAKDAGELGAGHSVTVLYELVMAPNGAGRAMTIRYRYKQPEEQQSRYLEQEVPHDEADWDETSDDFRFAAAVAQFGMLLRDSSHKGSSNYAAVLQLASGALGEDAFGYRAEFVELVRIAGDLAE